MRCVEPSPSGPGLTGRAERRGQHGGPRDRQALVSLLVSSSYVLRRSAYITRNRQPRSRTHPTCAGPRRADLESVLGGTMDEVRTAPRPEAVSSALSASSCPMRAQVLPLQRTVPGQGGGDWFAYKRTICRALADLRMGHWVAEAAPELDHPSADAAWGGVTSSRKYSAGRTVWLQSGQPSQSRSVTARAAQRALPLIMVLCADK